VSPNVGFSQFQLGISVFSLNFHNNWHEIMFFFKIKMQEKLDYVRVTFRIQKQMQESSFQLILL
jgi:hypothetical protein